MEKSINSKTKHPVIEGTLTAKGNQRAYLWMLLTLAAVFFIAQPTDWRLSNLSLTTLLMGIFASLQLIAALNYRRKVLFLIPFCLFLIIADMTVGSGYRGFVFASMLLFVIACATVRPDNTWLRRTWVALSLSCAILTILGFYRYFVGYSAPFTENSGGLYEAYESYFYLGISYLPATRNSDSLYFAVGCLASIHLCRLKTSGSLFFASLAIFEFLAVILSLSRGVIIACTISALLMLSLRYKAISIISLALGTGILASAPQHVFSYGLGLPGFWLKNALISLIDIQNANTSVSGMYFYSNDERLELITESLNTFAAWPFGLGVDNQYVSTGSIRGNILHSENFYVDCLVAFGVFSIVLFISFGRLWWNCVRRELSRGTIGIAGSALTLCGIYAIFNSPLDFAIFWFVLGLGIIESRSRPSTP